MKKVIIPILLGVLFVILLCYFLKIGFFSDVKPIDRQAKKLQVTTSFYPLYYFASQIAGDKATVINLTPAGAEPHDFEPNAKDIVTLEKSDMLIINGSGFEPWAQNLENDLKNKNVMIVTAADGLTKQEDPHVWLDPELAKQEISKITASFIEIDPQNKSFYEKNGKDFENRLEILNRSFKQGLSQCNQKNFVTSHAAFGYIASRYGLKQVSIAGISPDKEPSPLELGEIAKRAKENNVKYIFFETLVSPRLSQTIAKEIGARTLVLDPIEGITNEEQKAGRNYFSVQEDNLKNLRIALECK